MEQPRPETSSSQVTGRTIKSRHVLKANIFLVECTDPHDLFESVQPLLRRRLPLHNLHWKSSSRPLRSIDTLQVNLKKIQGRSSTTTFDGDRRRHQIPGLRETAYLKIFLLRCDDNETYKAIARKTVREWVKASTTSLHNTSSSNTPENHDAAEWLILHVVLPDTPAASQPKTSKHSSSDPSDSTENVTSKSKWPGRGSSTILDRLKSDFKTSSKAAVDRVAQIRLSRSSTNEHSTTTLSAQEIENQWDDMVEKLKCLILASFDLRVQQYEEDIRERDSQRNLPGWNFCTFFVLKEGLAKGFENVGLFEDALAGYDELSLGLDLVVREQALRGGDEHGGSFLHSSPELKETAEQSLRRASDLEKGETNGVYSNLQSLRLDPQDFPISSNNRPYRELILANNISIFQFRSYIFSRQLSLLLQAANAPSLMVGSSHASPSDTKALNDRINLSLLADTCHRAAGFIGVGARTMRQDLEHSLGFDYAEGSSESSSKAVVDNMILSWTYGVALQVLSQTSTPSLTIPDSTKTPPENGRLGDALDRGGEMPPDITLKHNLFGQERPSSQKSNEISSPQLWQKSRSPVRSGTQRYGSEKFASCRAELILLARKVLEELGRARGWHCDWRGIQSLYQNFIIEPIALENISLDSDLDNNAKPSVHGETSLAGLNQYQLTNSLTSRTAFERLFELLTDHALRHYLASDETRSAVRLTADIALLRFYDNDYEAAVYHLSRLVPFYGKYSWDVVSVAILQLYADCLKRLGRNEEYIDVLLKLLATIAGSGLESGHFVQRSNHFQSLLNDLFTFEDEGRTVTASLDQFYEIGHLPKAVSHTHGRDGFNVSVSIRPLLGQALHREGSLVLVLTATKPCAVDRIELSAVRPKCMSGQVLWYELFSNTTTWAKYYVSQIVFQVGNMRFIRSHDTSWNQSLDLKDVPSPSQQKTHIVVHPAGDSLLAQLIPCSLINLSELRTIEIELRSGWNNIKKGTVRVKPATAGLRVQTKQGRVTQTDGIEDVRFVQSERDQTIVYSHFRADSTARFALPYSLENPDIASVATKIEVTYETEKGVFEYAMNASTTTGLALTVNVQDVYQKQGLWSRFIVGPMTTVPIWLGRCEIPQSEHYDVEHAKPQHFACDIFPRESANLLFKFTPRKPTTNNSKQKPLELTIEYIPFDEWALAVLEDKFSCDLKAKNDSQLDSLKIPLLSHFMAPFKSQWAFGDLELLALIREINVPSYVDFGWQTLLGAYGKRAREVADSWLQQWHQENVTVRLSEQSPFMRQIVVPVEILKPRFVVTARLELHSEADVPISVGQAVSANLWLTHRSKWTAATEEELGVELTYELFAPPEIWLIGGRRKGSFTVHGEQKQVFPVMMLPQRPGHLLLPALDVKASVLEKIESDVIPFKKTDLRCELDYRNHAHSVLVIPNLRETTVALDGEGSSRRSWLIGSQVRNVGR